jgi:S1-C subfamily serine protease
VVVSLLYAGCGMRIASLADRRASFAPHTRSRVGVEPLAEYFGRRTALVIGGDELTAISPVKSSRASSSRCLIRGMATRFSAAAAIDSRGYFLTASHAFEKKPPFVAFNEGDDIRVLPTRVVWRGDVSKGEPDLAVLCAPCRLPSIFKWAATPAPGSLAFAAGVNSDARKKFELVCLAGRVERASLQARSRPASTIIFHLVPLHPGDSGGPLTSQDGRLLGINTMVELSPFRFSPLSVAERPDIDWIRELIARDAEDAG